MMNLVTKLFTLIGFTFMTSFSTPPAQAEIKNILFDLGGVIIDIDYHLSQAAFAKLGAMHFGASYSQQEQCDLFDRAETGDISLDDFRSEAKDVLGIKAASDAEFDTAWNALIVAFPKEKLDFLAELAKDYKVYLYSNTNEIHYRRFAALYTRATGKSFDEFNAIFTKTFYSHTLGMRKPHQASFAKVIEDSSFNAEETLFVDDSAQNLVGAKAAGLQTLLITKENTIFQIPAYIEQLSLHKASAINTSFRSLNKDRTTLLVQARPVNPSARQTSLGHRKALAPSSIQTFVQQNWTTSLSIKPSTIAGLLRTYFRFRFHR